MLPLLYASHFFCFSHSLINFFRRFLKISLFLSVTGTPYSSHSKKSYVRNISSGFMRAISFNARFFSASIASFVFHPALIVLHAYDTDHQAMLAMQWGVESWDGCWRTSRSQYQSAVCFSTTSQGVCVHIEALQLITSTYCWRFSFSSGERDLF